MYDVITIGSGTVDAFVETENRLFLGKNGHIKIPFGYKILIEEVRFDTGGSGTNTGVAFARLGLKTAWIGKIGSGTNSQRIIDAMKREKVDTSLVKREKNDRTGFSVILDASGHDRTILAYKGSNDDLSINDIDLRKLNTRWIYLGSMMGKAFGTIEKVAAYAHKKGIKVAFNPSAYLAKKGIRFLGNILKNVDLLVLNKEEAQYLVGKKSMDEMLKSLNKLGPSISIITDGKKGSHAYDGRFEYSIIPPKVKVIETTGAGDSFASGVLAGLLKKGDIEFALQLGQKEAESVISHPGAKNILLTWKQAEKIKGRKVVKRRL